MLSKAHLLLFWMITNTIHASPGGWTNFLISFQKIIIYFFIYYYYYYYYYYSFGDDDDYYYYYYYCLTVIIIVEVLLLIELFCYFQVMDTWECQGTLPPVCRPITWSILRHSTRWYHRLLLTKCPDQCSNNSMCHR